MEGVFWRRLRAAGPALAAMGATVAVVVAGPRWSRPPPRPRWPSGRSALRGRPPTPRVVVVLGDSTALTLGYALAATAPPGTTVVNGGLYGCGLAVGSWVSNDPPTPQLQMFPACNEVDPDVRSVAGARRSQGVGHGSR